MRLGGRLAAAIEVLDDIERRHRPAADALKDWGLSHRFAGAGDRAAIGNIVYDALRRKLSAGWLLDADTPRAAAFGALFLEQAETPDTLTKTLEGDRFAPAPLSAAERQSVEERLTQVPPELVAADCPEWAAPHLQAAFGEDWVAEAQGLARRPPPDLRVNTLTASRAKVLAELNETGAVATAIAAQGIRIAPIAGAGRHPNVQAEPAFQKGWFEVQDEGSQIAAALAGAEPGMQILDFCAGAGGKTLAMAAAMQNRGQIYAYDSEKVRLAPIFDRIRRAESRNVQVLSKASELEPHRGQMELVLVDAPCTGSGTWRRRPDAKWRLSPRQLEARIAEQKAILSEASRYVRPGGRLAYITCSVFPQENASQVSDFLPGNAEFHPVDHGALWNGIFPGHPNAARIDPAHGIHLSPARSGTDGFYFCALQRTK